MRAVQLTSFGDPVDVLQYVDIPEPDAPGPNQVLIGVEFSPINPNDLMVAQGIYAFRPPLPAVIGDEGVGPGSRGRAGGGERQGRRPDPGAACQLHLEQRLSYRRAAFPPSPLTRTRGSSGDAGDESDCGAAAQRVCRPEAGRVGGAERRRFRCRAVGDRLCESAWREDRDIVRRPGARRPRRTRDDRRRYVVVDFSRCPGQDRSDWVKRTPPGARWRQRPSDGRAQAARRLSPRRHAGRFPAIGDPRSP